jgi:uncharacterized protein YcbX
VTGTVAAIWRYPVKSMLGESLAACEVTAAGIVGDRAFALIDAEDGTVASAKNPRKWGRLLDCRATFLDDGAVEIALPDGGSVRSDDPDVDARLGAVVGRPVRLAATAPDDRAFEEVWPDIEGLAPEELIAGTTIGHEDGEPVSRLPLGLAAPPGTFFDLAVLHALTTATLARLRALAPDATFAVERYRPNVLLDVGDGAAGGGFVENDWVGRTVTFGGARMAVSMPTMRCVMTTLPQQGLPRDRETLRTIAAHNRLEIAGLGQWACAGVYGDVAQPGRVRVGDPVAVDG